MAVYFLNPEMPEVSLKFDKGRLHGVFVNKKQRNQKKTTKKNILYKLIIQGLYAWHPASVVHMARALHLAELVFSIIIFSTHHRLLMTERAQHSHAVDMN